MKHQDFKDAVRRKMKGFEVTANRQAPYELLVFKGEKFVAAFNANKEAAIYLNADSKVLSKRQAGKLSELFQEHVLPHPDLFTMETLLYTARSPEPGYTGLCREGGRVRMTNMFTKLEDKPDGCFFYVEHRSRTAGQVRKDAKKALDLYNEGMGMVY